MDKEEIARVQKLIKRIMIYGIRNSKDLEELVKLHTADPVMLNEALKFKISNEDREIGKQEDKRLGIDRHF